MRISTAYSLAVASLLGMISWGAIAAPVPKEEPDAVKLQGRWKIESIRNGKVETKGISVLELKGDKMTLTSEYGVTTATFKLEVVDGVRRFEAKDSQLTVGGKTSRDLDWLYGYEIEGNTLKFAMTISKDGNLVPVPPAKAGDDGLVIVMTRIKE